MFSNKSLQLRFSLKLILYRNKGHKSRVANPGIENRLKIIPDKNNHDFEDDNFDYEFDIDESKNLYSQHKHELHQQKEKLKLLITRQKYFKEKNPNFLTWQEKENIKYLHNLNPEENTPEKLSENFPALPETIRKILKAKWRPQSNHRIEIHNEKVKRNWNDFLTNKLQLSKELSEHLQKFSSTHKNIENIPKINKIVISAPKTSITLAKTEFQDLLKIGKTNSTRETENTDTDCKEIIDNRIIQNVNKIPTKPITLGKLKQIVSIEENVSKTNSTETEISRIQKPSKLTTNINLANRDSVITSDIPDRIEIPKKYWEKGKIYKVSDCYYDDDGEFLYRVPGMK